MKHAQENRMQGRVYIIMWELTGTQIKSDRGSGFIKRDGHVVNESLSSAFLKLHRLTKPYKDISTGDMSMILTSKSADIICHFPMNLMTVNFLN